MTHEPQEGMSVEGWATLGTYADSVVIYGVFPTKEEAEKWASNLVSGDVHPIYSPMWNRG